MRRDREVHRLGLRGVEDLSRDVLVDVVQVGERKCWSSWVGRWAEERWEGADAQGLGGTLPGS